MFKKKSLILGAFLVLKKSVSPGVKNTLIFKKPSLFVGLCEPPKNTNAMLKNTSFYALRENRPKRPAIRLKAARQPQRKESPAVGRSPTPRLASDPPPPLEGGDPSGNFLPQTFNIWDNYFLVVGRSVDIKLRHIFAVGLQPYPNIVRINFAQNFSNGLSNFSVHFVHL